MKSLDEIIEMLLEAEMTDDTPQAKRFYSIPSEMGKQLIDYLSELRNYRENENFKISICRSRIEALYENRILGKLEFQEIDRILTE